MASSSFSLREEDVLDLNCIGDMLLANFKSTEFPKPEYLSDCLLFSLDVQLDTSQWKNISGANIASSVVV